MPALAKSSVGSLWGTTLDEGTAVWPFVSKNSTKVARTLSPAVRRSDALSMSAPCIVEHQDLQEHLAFDESGNPALQHGWQAHPSGHEIWIPVDPNIQIGNRYVACYQDSTRRFAKNGIISG